tara:strand:- start:1010 stop:1492 length:483 start_codon:yes stop_codon:yes gene_type:complete
MDYLAHALWSIIIFHKTKKIKWAVLFGLLPDSLSWMIYMFYNLLFNGFQRGAPHLESIPDWVFTLYGLSHSIIICAIVFGIVYLILKKVPLYMYAWPVAIVMDIPTHSKEFLPTPFLWPFNVYFDGISWGNPWFMLVNYSLIGIGLVWVYKNLKKRKNSV